MSPLKLPCINDPPGIHRLRTASLLWPDLFTSAYFTCFDFGHNFISCLLNIFPDIKLTSPPGDTHRRHKNESLRGDTFCRCPYCGMCMHNPTYTNRDLYRRLCLLCSHYKWLKSRLCMVIYSWTGAGACQSLSDCMCDWCVFDLQYIYSGEKRLMRLIVGYLVMSHLNQCGLAVKNYSSEKLISRKGLKINLLHLVT